MSSRSCGEEFVWSVWSVWSVGVVDMCDCVDWGLVDIAFFFLKGGELV